MSQDLSKKIAYSVCYGKLKDIPNGYKLNNDVFYSIVRDYADCLSGTKFMQLLVKGVFSDAQKKILIDEDYLHYDNPNHYKYLNTEQTKYLLNIVDKRNREQSSSKDIQNLVKKEISRVKKMDDIIDGFSKIEIDFDKKLFEKIDSLEKKINKKQESGIVYKGDEVREGISRLKKLLRDHIKSEKRKQKDISDSMKKEAENFVKVKKPITNLSFYKKLNIDKSIKKTEYIGHLTEVLDSLKKLYLSKKEDSSSDSDSDSSSDEEMKSSRSVSLRSSNSSNSRRSSSSSMSSIMSPGKMKYGDLTAYKNIRSVKAKTIKKRKGSPVQGSMKKIGRVTQPGEYYEYDVKNLNPYGSVGDSRSYIVSRTKQDKVKRDLDIESERMANLIIRQSLKELNDERRKKAMKKNK